MGRLSLSYRTKFWLLAGLTLGLAVITGVAMGAAIPVTDGVANPVLMLSLFFGLIAVIALFNWLWWKRTDELQQQGQLVSWWWGANIVGLPFVVSLMVLTGRHSDLALGAQYLLLAQCSGFAVVWLVWKFRGRGPAE